MKNTCSSSQPLLSHTDGGRHGHYCVGKEAYQRRDDEVIAGVESVRYFEPSPDAKSNNNNRCNSAYSAAHDNVDHSRVANVCLHVR